MNSEQTRPIIGITMGDPVGIGPEILIKALCSNDLFSFCRPLVIGDANIIQHILTRLDIQLSLHLIEHPSQGKFSDGTIDLIARSCLDASSIQPGLPTPETGRAMEDYILYGTDLALKKEIDAVVTCPITKTAMKLAGSDFHGHTELLAHRTHAPEYAMMMAGDTLKVVLVTIHIPLKNVTGSLNKENITRTIRITHSALKNRFGISNPVIGIAGLNPHAGEDGMFGNEETKVIEPAVKLIRESGINAVGPLPPDTVFYKAAAGDFDAVVCMYHDQGLIPFKLLHFDDGVNITLGLPIIRTSVDHGTAYDIAWQGKANPSSLVKAIEMAAFQARNRQDRA